MERLGIAFTSVLPVDDITAGARAAEEHGYDSVWVTEGSGKDAFSQLTAAAVATKKVRLATGVIPIFSRTPYLLAMTACALDEVSGGRATLGLGVGHKGFVEGTHGVPFDRPQQRLREYVTLLRSLFSDQPVSFQGQVLRLPTARRPYPLKGRIPIYTAVLSLSMARLAGEIADGVLLNLAPSTHIGRVIEAVHEGARKAGRDPGGIDIACYILAAPDTAESAVQGVRGQIARYGGMPFYQKMYEESGFTREVSALREAWGRSDRESAQRAVSDRMMEALAVLGSGQRDRIKMFRLAGVTLPILFAAVPLAGARPQIAKLAAAFAGA
ncbi:MAG: LLM class flavin-dependent oxidoreductase [Dehalococcoidia bacterium]|nr:LLM class flavin-dependent oxidoreductase [Dehalococcoidia bacterium]